MVEEVNTLVTVLSTASSTGLIVFVVWYFDMRKEQARAKQHKEDMELLKQQHGDELKLQKQQYAESMELLKNQHREIVEMVRKEWADGRHSIEEKMTEQKQMYVNNVSLVKKSQELAEGFKEVIIMNTQGLQKALDAVNGNQFCPLNRNEIAKGAPING